jgi:hypothetical protein
MFIRRDTLGLLPSPTRRSLLKLTGLFGLGHLLPASATVAAQTGKTLIPVEEVQFYLVSSSPPKWNAGWLISWDHQRTGGSPSIGLRLFYEPGRRYDNYVFTAPDLAGINVGDAAVGADGRIALVGAADQLDGTRFSFLAQISPDRGRQELTRLLPFVGLTVAFGPDGTIWSVGRIYMPEDEWRVEVRLLRSYSPSCALGVSREIRLRNRNEVGGRELLAVSKDRGGWMSARGGYHEFLFDGTEVAYFDGMNGSLCSGLGISDNNDVVTFHTAKKALVVLDRVTKQWVTTTLPKGLQLNWTRVLGFDGDLLVMRDTGNALRKMRLQ